MVIKGSYLKVALLPSVRQGWLRSEIR
jgi:hypothetical protein